MNGRMMSYTGKVTSVYNQQGNTWRSVHVHESINPERSDEIFYASH